jgi:hypothetical protein
MIRIAGEEPKGEVQGALFRFTCQGCGKDLEATGEELEPSWWNKETMRFMCPRCKCPRYVEQKDLEETE